MEIGFIENIDKKSKPNQNQLGFGQHFTDYMFEMDYIDGEGWVNPTIKPYAPISLDPSAMVFHYGQSVFEGLKAYRTKDDRVLLFRPEKNIERLNKSNARMCIPEIDKELILKAISELVKVDKDWIPNQKGTSLYIRPFVFATDYYVGVRQSHNYKFLIILSPVGAYYSEGFNPVKIFIEQQYVRAVKGGVGEAKTAGNYAASIKAQSEAKEKGFSQVLWLDGAEHKYIEEVGAMNIFIMIGEEILTPELTGSILDGVTRRSTIELLRASGYQVTERKITIDEIIEAQFNGRLKEVFGTGTAAVISPVGEMWFEGQKILINGGEVGNVSQKLYDQLTGIQTGDVEDEFGWTIDISK
ncbi:branched-chain amino acid aminotransferase [Sediminitomix flava]|uniref:Branched-chain-amino-acid aminotransferase n=1 Tax=Sediminitomix flava TaxID=379075 RepID=A0A315YY86_SEDFL|nr:branched-chain amino acid aminotransferase [Sediminitomix flava]PWJ35017.1 branched chain amino acid aminotransferase [Sediminitomix flava]